MCGLEVRAPDAHAVADHALTDSSCQERRGEVVAGKRMPPLAVGLVRVVASWTSPLGLLAPPLPVTNRRALAAFPFSPFQRVRKAVVGRQFVPPLAMGLCCVVGTLSVAAQGVLTPRHGAAVVGIAAPTGSVVAGKVVEFQAVRDWAYFALVPDGMSESKALPVPRLAVSLTIPGAGPDVTPVLVPNPCRGVFASGSGCESAHVVSISEGSTHREI